MLSHWRGGVRIFLFCFYLPLSTHTRTRTAGGLYSLAIVLCVSARCELENAPREKGSVKTGPPTRHQQQPPDISCDIFISLTLTAAAGKAAVWRSGWLALPAGGAFFVRHPTFLACI